ncbi:hypothetical protein BASA81_012701 [Batrachochytrium salamandrivorans]|nr:hypothetical protein BASA81_012701 [Batrachochytrium salamandrivorans]
MSRLFGGGHGGIRWVGQHGLASAKKKKPVSLEQEFQRLTPLEHILTCPNMYIGSTTATPRLSHIKAFSQLLSAKESHFVHVGEDNTYVPAMVKVFDEVLVNACDNAIRDPANTKSIAVEFDGKTFTVENDGAGIPILMHPKEQLFIPEMVLGHLLTGSNFDKSQDKDATGGRHGYGAKLTNVFSTKFACETVDAQTDKKFTMKWKDNMTQVSQPATVVDSAKSKPYTKISFSPDWQKLGMPGNKIDLGSLQMIQARVAETAGLLGPNVTVKWNGKAVPKVNNFKSLCEVAHAGLSANQSPSKVVMLLDLPGKLRVAVSTSPAGSGFTPYSYVNNMSTWRGGVHVDLITSQLCRYVQTHLVKKALESDVKKHLQVFVDFRSSQPEFDSQSKEKLTGTGNREDLILPDSALKKLAGMKDLVELVEDGMQSKLLKRITKSTAIRKVIIPKLEDALYAGTGKPCTLILTEGDSAKASAMCGLEVVGREAYGVFPLRGKALNVRGVSLAAVAESREIMDLITILGLEFGVRYANQSSLDKLRYTRVMFMADGDHDGNHIKALLLNFFDYYWPELAKHPGFLTQFVTPLLKALPISPASSVNNKKKLPSMEFFTQIEYDKWREAQLPAVLAKYRIKYYKGLGTSTPDEAKGYFSNLNKHVMDFAFTHPDKDSETLDMVFNRARAGDRKRWLTNYVSVQEVPAQFLPDGTRPPLSVDSFLNNELVQYSMYDNTRSIPHVLDGLKTSQRKILYALMLKPNPEEETKLTRLSGFVAERTSYHHGEQSLHVAMIKMAQDYVGSHNLPLLRAYGQFGSRAAGGEDMGSPRYLGTALSSVAKLLFPIADNDLLIKREDDGIAIEPYFYIPILPMVLINGAQGLGTGWSCNCPQFHPLDVANAVRCWINGQSLPELHPWYRGFLGRIEPSPKGYATFGNINMVVPPITNGRDKSRPKLLVTELPINLWSDDFKQDLKLRVENGTGVYSFADLGKGGNLEIEILVDESITTPELLLQDLQKKSLTSYLTMQNLHFFSPSCEGIKRFGSVNEIIREFCECRLELYVQRRNMVIENTTAELEVLERERAFVEKVCGKDRGSLVKVLGEEIKTVQANLSALGFSPQESNNRS